MPGDDLLEMSEQALMESKAKKSKLLQLALLSLAVLGLGIYIFGDSIAFFSDPPKPPQARLPQNTESAGRAPVASPAPEKKTNGSQIEIAALLDSESRVTKLATLEDQKRELELKKDIAVLEKQIREAILPSVPRGVEAPGLQAFLPRKDQAMPTVEQKAPKQAQEPRGVAPGRLISIQGVNGNLSATIRDPSKGIVTLRQGSDWNGGKVIGISRQGIALRVGGQNKFVAF